MSDSPAHMNTNRLIHSSSPYLLQHAHNPVDWYPWGAEAIETARRLNRPIFLSVGYSTCYWCHVMERQSFENEGIAGLMNELFVNIKVDREERPDVDQLYMTAVQILTRQGGWPMSVFLTPDLRPFFGGTYFPPTDSYGRPGFPRVLRSIAEAYANKRDQVERSAEEIVRLLQRVAEPRQPLHPIRFDLSWIESLIERSTADFDQCYGGFSGAPKFPRQTLLELLLEYVRSPHATEDAQQIRQQVLYTLDFMADGGIRDQLGGGFHRYSTDEKWLVPHFEIMLYDQAMLAVCYARAWEISGTARYQRIARGICDFVLREMTSPAGGFYTAFDAEVDAQEGLSYLWTKQEAEEEMTAFSKEDAHLFMQTYGLLDGPNFADPHHGNGQPDKNILFLPGPLETVAKKEGMTEEALDGRLASMRQALYAARQKRKQPLLDTKILTSWNGLMIRALAIAGKVFGEGRYVAAAESAARFLLERHRLADGTLIRTSRLEGGGQTGAPVAGFLDDYAFLAQALLALHEASGEARWREEALRVAGVMKEKFLDADLGGFFFTPSDASEMIVRQKAAQDSPLPSGNAAAAQCLLEMGEVEEARGTLAVFAQSMEDSAEGMSSMVQAALAYLEKQEPFAVAAAGEEAVERPASADQLAKEAVDLSARWETPGRLVVQAQVREGFHLNAHEAGPGLTPTSLEVGAAEIQYPEGVRRSYPYADAPMAVYEGRVEFRALFSGPLPAGTMVRVTLRYQPCTQDACLAATQKSIEVRAPQ